MRVSGHRPVPQCLDTLAVCRDIFLTLVSMLNAELLDKFNTIGKSIREDSRPFGGLQVSLAHPRAAGHAHASQLVFCGDFFQLPPVSKGGSYGVGPKFAFDAECWEKAFPRSSIIHLKSVFRQTDDTFVKVLESMRRGSLTDEQDLLLRRLDRPLSMTDGISPVRL